MSDDEFIKTIQWLTDRLTKAGRVANINDIEATVERFRQKKKENERKKDDK